MTRKILPPYSPEDLAREAYPHFRPDFDSLREFSGLLHRYAFTGERFQVGSVFGDSEPHTMPEIVETTGIQRGTVFKSLRALTESEPPVLNVLQEGSGRRPAIYRASRAANNWHEGAIEREEDFMESVAPGLMGTIERVFVDEMEDDPLFEAVVALAGVGKLRTTAEDRLVIASNLVSRIGHPQSEKELNRGLPPDRSHRAERIFPEIANADRLFYHHLGSVGVGNQRNYLFQAIPVAEIVDIAQ